VGSFISNIGYIKKYGRNIFGMTRTLGGAETAELFKQVYAVNLLRIPRFRERKFREVPGRILATSSIWRSEILKSVQEQAALGRGCLVVCQTIQEAMDLHGILKAHIPERNLKLYVRSDDQQQERIVETMLEPGDVIVATNLAGRGTDIKVSKGFYRPVGCMCV
jgi:preprotein translocase subunit SecA